MLWVHMASKMVILALQRRVKFRPKWCYVICEQPLNQKYFEHFLQAVNREMLGRGSLDALVKDNYDFEDWTPIQTSNRRSRDFENDDKIVLTHVEKKNSKIFDFDVAEDRSSYSSENDYLIRQRESRKRPTDNTDKYFYPEEIENARNENDLENEIGENSIRAERDGKAAFLKRQISEKK